MQDIRTIIDKFVGARSVDEVVSTVFAPDSTSAGSTSGDDNSADSLKNIFKALPNTWQDCMEKIESFAQNDLDRVIMYSSAIRSFVSSNLWLHYNLALALNRLVSAGHASARMPCMIHCFLVIQNCIGRSDGRNASAVPSSILARELRSIAPRDAIRNALDAMSAGAISAKDELICAAQLLNIPMSNSQSLSRIRDIREISRKCGLPTKNPFEVVSLSEYTSKYLERWTFKPPSETTWPAPHGDSHFYVFRRAGTPMKVPEITVYGLQDGVFSIDISSLGRTEFYAFDKDRKCIDDLSWGANPFITDDLAYFDGDLGVVDDRFSGSMNICHFLLDKLTRVPIYHAHSRGAGLLWLENNDYCKQIFELIGLAQFIHGSDSKRISVQAKMLMITSNNIGIDFVHPGHCGAEWAMEYIRNVFAIEDARDSGSVSSRRLYISRSDARNRRVKNEDKLIPLLVDQGFEIVTLSGRSAQEQVRMFRQASHVVAPHGAGLTNVVFSRPGTKVLELFSPLYGTRAYWGLCASLKHSYSALIGEDIEYAKPDYTKWVHSGYHIGRDLLIDPTSFSAALDTLLTR